jgi:hypothetical protein
MHTKLLYVEGIHSLITSIACERLISVYVCDVEVVVALTGHRTGSRIYMNLQYNRKE